MKNTLNHDSSSLLLSSSLLEVSPPNKFPAPAKSTVGYFFSTTSSTTATSS